MRGLGGFMRGLGGFRRGLGGFMRGSGGFMRGLGGFMRGLGGLRRGVTSSRQLATPARMTTVTSPSHCCCSDRATPKTSSQGVISVSCFRRCLNSSSHASASCQEG
eukprot:853682-Prorocentrum_minimum.AAC.1